MAGNQMEPRINANGIRHGRVEDNKDNPKIYESEAGRGWQKARRNDKETQADETDPNFATKNPYILLQNRQ